MRKRNLLRIVILLAILLGTILLGNSSTGKFGATVQGFPGPDPSWKQNYGGFLSDERAYSVIQTSDGGYMLAGTIYSYPSPPTGYHSLLVKTDSSGNMQWNGTYAGGGNNEDYVRSVVQTNDGGYVFAGYTRGPPNPSLIFYSWLVKTDSSGNPLWNKIYTSLGQNYVYSMIKTNDGGFALAGKGLTTPNGSTYEAMLLKIDSSGNIVWSKTYGVSGDFAYSVVQTSDGGYAVAGSALWKTDSTGNLQWSKVLGDSEALEANSLIQSSDGGYAYVGDKRSLQVGNDIFMVKTDSNGNTQWDYTYGGSQNDAGYSLVQTADGGYILVGSTQSFGAGNWDGYLVRTNSLGLMDWWDYFGGSFDDGLYCVIKTSDGGLALGGYTKSYTNGGYDMWLIKMSTLPSTYSATIWAWDPDGWIAEPITMDGVPTGFNTPYTVTGLTGTHTVTVPSTDVHGYSFSDWYSGETSPTITVTQGGTYTARYGVPTNIVKTWYWGDDTVIKSIAYGDVDNDGKVDTVTAGYYWDGTRYTAQLCVWDSATLALKNVKTWYWTSTTLINSVSVGDVDGDGKQEIVTGGYFNDGTRSNAQLCVWDGANLALKNIKTWYWTGDTEIVSVAIGDTNADGKNEIVTGGSYYNSNYIAQLCVWDGATLALKNVQTWYWTSYTYINSVAVGDVNGDGKADIVTGGAYWENGHFNAQLCIWGGATLSLENVKTWYWTGSTSISSVGVGDVNNDGKTEIITGGYYNDGSRVVAQLCVWDGQTLALNNVLTWYWTNNTSINSVTLGDFDKDGKIEIITGGYFNDGTRSNAQLCVWNGASLALKNVKTWYWTGDTSINSISAGDLFGNSETEVLTGGNYYDGTRQVAQLCLWT